MNCATTVISGEIKEIRVWVLGDDANGAPAFSMWKIGVTPDEYDNGVHYQRAIEMAEDAGYEGTMRAFDERDPAGLDLTPIWDGRQEVRPGMEVA